VTELHEIAARYKEWEVSASPEIREVWVNGAPDY